MLRCRTSPESFGLFSSPCAAALPPDQTAKVSFLCARFIGPRRHDERCGLDCGWAEEVIRLPRNMRKFPILLLVILSSRVFSAETTSDSVKPGEPTMVHFDGALPAVTGKVGEVQYNYDLTKENFEVFVPTNYSSREAFGLFAFIDSQNEMSIPKEWMSLMERNKLICLIPQRIGNDQPPARRLGLTLVGILKMTEQYRIDSKRIFVSGYSGGARCSVHLAFLHSDLITGNISICGADFYEPVPQVKATDVQGYGPWPVRADRAAGAKAKARFVFITGDKDFRHGNILDIYAGGFVRNNFQARLIDVPGMGHQLCKPEALQDAVSFLDDRR
jgi:hypothetical protein